MSAFQSPNYTQTPNDFFAMLPDMSDAEVRVTLVMIRQTFGWHKDTFKMGLDKLAAAAGLSRQGALDGAAAAETRGTFRRANPNGNKEAEWELAVALQPVEGSPPASRGLSEVKERIKQKEIPPTNEEQKPDLVDGLIKYHLGPKSVQNAIRDYFKLTPNWEAKYNKQFMEWAVESNITPEQVKQAADLWRSDKRFNWAAPSLKGIQEHWLELTPVVREQERDADGSFYA